MELTFSEIEDVLDVKYNAVSTIGYSIPPEIYEISDFNLMIMFLLPNKLKVKIKNDDVRLKSNFTLKKNKKDFLKKIFYAILSFTLSHSGVLGDIEGFIQKIPGK